MKFVISDNERELDILSDPDIRLLEDGLEMPLVARELTFAESADSDGRKRIRSKNQNAEGRIGVHISGTSDSHFRDKIDNVLELVESAHRSKGSIVYEPPGGTAVAYDIEAITVTGLPQTGIELQNRRQNAEITFEVQPYGRLEPTQLVTSGTISGPIDYVTVENVPGQVDAPVSLELTEAASQNRYFVEVGVQNEFDPTDPEPLLLTAGSMPDADDTLVAVGGTAGTGSRPASTYTNVGGTAYTIRRTVTTNPSVLAKSNPLSHTGLWKIRARVQPSAKNVLVRLRWRSGFGTYTTEQWVVIESEDQWVDVDLGTVNIPVGSVGTPLELQIQGASSTGTATLDLDYVSIIPADRYVRLRGQDSTEVAALNAGRTMTLTDREALAEIPLPAWTARSASAAKQWLGVTFANGTFVAVAGSNSKDVMTSTDGITWTGGTLSEFGSWNEIVYGNGLFVAVAFGGIGDITTSPDAINWTTRSAPENNQWVGLGYGSGTFVATSLDGTNRVMTSGDGINWTSRSAAEQNQWTSVAYGGGVFVAVSIDGTNRVMTSTDAINWTARSAAEQNEWQAVTYGDGLFVAVAGSGTNRVMTSTDGITWTARSAIENNDWGSITYGEGLFVAVSDDGDNQVMSSPDGIVWTSRPSPETNSWASVTYGDGLFVAVSADGTNRVMTSTLTEFFESSFNQRVPIVEGTYPLLPPATRNGDKSRIVIRGRREDVQAGTVDAGLTDPLLASLSVTPRVLLR